MILKNNLYKILSINLGGPWCDVELLPESEIFKAHFPGRPILPGVCIIQMAGELWQNIMGFDVELESVTNAKFLAVIDPTVTKNLHFSFEKFTFSEDRNSMKVPVAVSDGDTVFSKLSLVYRRVTE